MNRFVKGLLIFIGVVTSIILIGVIVVWGYTHYGKSALYKANEDTIVVPEEFQVDKENKNIENWQEDWIRYDGDIYEYNDEILTFLIMGTDQKGKVKEQINQSKGGQADALFLVTLNPDTKKIDVITINRNTMTDVEFYDNAGNYLETKKAQITLSHAYGDGMELSCKRATAAVSNLFYQIPIHGYCSISMAAIAKVNDAIGGVTLTAIEDVSSRNKVVIKKGEEITLDGNQAMAYLRGREENQFDSASNRSARQQQYISIAAKQIINKLSEDIGIVTELYNVMKDYMVTDLSLDKIVYLATSVIGYDFNSDRLHSMVGITVQGEKYEEFYPDNEDFYELMIDVFYQKVEPK